MKTDTPRTDAADTWLIEGQRLVPKSLALSLERESSSLSAQVRGLEDGLRELLAANALYERLSATSVGDKVHEARERQFNAEMTARSLLAKTTPQP